MVKIDQGSYRQHEWRIENLRGAITMAVESLKMLVLVNGGAAIGLLSFFGAHSGRAIPKLALSVFGIGVAAAALAALFGYGAQRTVAVEGPYEMCYARAAIVLAVLSALAFVGGMVVASCEM